MTLAHSIKTNVSLKQYNTFKVGGNADFLVEVDDLQRLEGVVEWAQDHQQKVFILGGGSNTLFMDEGFNGLVIKMNNKNITTELCEGKGRIKCGAGVKLSRVIKEAFKNNLTGLEWAVGIPGTIGGAVRGNAGAFGGEMKDIVEKVRAISIKKCEQLRKGHEDVIIYPNELVADDDKECKDVIQVFKNKDCEFEYRKSVFKESVGLMVWDIEIVLSKGDTEEGKKTAAEYLKRRQEKQPDITKFPSAGSVFKNPKVAIEVQEKFKHDTEVEAKGGKIPAGWLIGRCGLKGKKIGDAMVGKEHGNFIVNMGDAKATDILLLISIIKTKVRNKYGVQLQEEICIVH